jgi:hypothetical protein
MATIRYNGLPIYDAKITRFAAHNEFESSNFNRTGLHHTIEGVGIVTGTVANSLLAVKRTLTEPAQKLEVQFSDQAPSTWTTLADGAGAASNYDSRNGPLPEISVTEIAGVNNTAAFVVGFTFNWFDAGDPSSVIKRAEIITTHSIDIAGMLRISRRGFLSISAGLKGSVTAGEATGVASNTSPTKAKPYGNPLTPNTTAAQSPPYPDLYRRLIAGQPPVGFQRVKQEFYVQADQVTLGFDVEDVELQAILPQPALDGDASFEYSRGIDDDRNIAGTKTFKIELTSDPNTPIADLFKRCVDVALTKIKFVGECPDIIQSFRISQPSLFKRNTIGLEITAMGSIRNARFEFDPNASVDQWLYVVLFDSPNKTTAGAYMDPYGSLAHSSAANTSPLFRYDAFATTLNPVWNAITTVSQGVLVNITQAASADGQAASITDSNNQPATKTTSTPPDDRLKIDAQKIVTFNSSQSIDINTNCNFLMPMGFGVQFAFQWALPEVVILQRVEMTTRDQTVPIPWPEVRDAFVVLSQSIQVNDAPPDASGNKFFAIHATRRIKVSVYNSQFTTNIAGASTSLASAGTQMSRVVWMPTAVTSGRNPISGTSMVSIQENRAGELYRQDYLGSAQTPTA